MKIIIALDTSYSMGQVIIVFNVSATASPLVQSYAKLTQVPRREVFTDGGELDMCVLVVVERLL